MYNNNRNIGQLKTYDPRKKLYILLIYILIVLVSWKLPVFLISLLVAVIILLLCRVRPMSILVQSGEFIAVLLLMGLLLTLFTNVKAGVYFVVKTLMITFVYLAIMKNMKQIEVLDGLSLGFKMKAAAARRLSLIMDFIPMVEREKRRVRKAQMARGVESRSGNIFHRFRRELMLFVPNYRNTYIKIKRQKDVMNMRQFTSVKRRTRVHELSMTWIDEVVVIFFMIIFLLCILLMIIL